eukprot:scaffold13.g403.t1
MDLDVTFDFEQQLERPPPHTASAPGADGGPPPPGFRDASKPRNYRQTVCTYWLRGLCMKGDTCGFLHQFDPARMPVCRNLLKFGACKEPDCPYKHSTDEIKECNMYRLGFCIYGPACRFKHTRQPGPAPDPSQLEAAKPREHRNLNVVANQANTGIAPIPERPFRRPRHDGPHSGRLGLPTPHGSGGGALQPYAGPGGWQQSGVRPPPVNAPSFVDASVLNAVGQSDLRYGF